MGYAGIDSQINYLQLPYGSSKDYSIKVNQEFNELIKKTFKQKPGNWFK